MSIRLFALVVAVVIVSAAAAVPAAADRNILTPTGETLETGRFRGEAIIQASETDNRTLWAAVGLGRFEIEGQRETRARGRSDNMLNFQMSVMPQTTLSPAIAVGVMDLTDEIDRTLYAAVSKTVPFTQALPLPIRDIRLSAGLAGGRISGIFAGAEADLLGFRVQAEFDGDDFNAAFGFPFMGIATAKALWVRDDFYLGVEVKPRF